jgi:uncharacterized protein (TIGR03067 family)
MMKKFFMSAFFLGLSGMVLMGSSTRQPDEIDKEFQRLEGTWKLVSYKGPDRDREFADDDFFGKRELVIKDKEWIERRIGRAEGRRMKATLDPSSSPKTVDLVYQRGDKVYTRRSLYVLEGDTLRVLTSSRGSHIRPKDLEDPDTNVGVWERVKK